MSFLKSFPITARRRDASRRKGPQRHLRAAPAPSVTVRAPGKINLSLRVGALGEDGYHRLVTVFQAVTLFEEVTATAAPLGSGITVTVVGPQADVVPTDRRNLAFRAAEILASNAGVAPNVALHLVKGVPVAGGMAGGSADAAATLVACDALWETKLPRGRLHELAARIGSDVPFCLLGGTAVGMGRGTLLTPAMTSGEFHWAFAVVDQGLATPEVFRVFDELPDVGPLDPDPDPALMAALRAGDAEALGATLRNDLQDAALALRPELSRAIDLAERSNALGVVMSGSGPTIAALGRNARHARAIAAQWLAADFADSVWMATGPAPGARIVSG